MPVRFLRHCLTLLLALQPCVAVAEGSGGAANPASAETAGEVPPQLEQLVIASALVAGTYYPAAGAVCREVNRRQELNGLRCLVEETEGSADNLARLRDGRVQLAIVQSDWAYHAVAGSSADRAPPMTELRSLLLLQPQVMTLVAGAGSGLLTQDDLPGKRIAIGPPDSGVNEGGRGLLQQLGLLGSVTLAELPVEAQAAALCADEIDAFLLPVAHPNAGVADAIDLCGAILVGLEGEVVDTLVTTWPFYVKATIPAGLYPPNGIDVISFGVVATLVATTALSEESAYQLVKAVFEALDDLRAQHPTLALLTEQSMTGVGMAAPLHPGALRYYQERGWR